MRMTNGHKIGWKKKRKRKIFLLKTPYILPIETSILSYVPYQRVVVELFVNVNEIADFDFVPNDIDEVYLSRSRLAKIRKLEKDRIKISEMIWSGF